LDEERRYGGCGCCRSEHFLSDNKGIKDFFGLTKREIRNITRNHGSCSMFYEGTCFIEKYKPFECISYFCPDRLPEKERKELDESQFLLKATREILRAKGINIYEPIQVIENFMTEEEKERLKKHVRSLTEKYKTRQLYVFYNPVQDVEYIMPDYSEQVCRNKSDLSDDYILVKEFDLETLDLYRGFILE